MTEERAITKKKEAMFENPDLFKRFQEAVKRGRHLQTIINLCDEVIEMFVFENQQVGERHQETYFGIKNVIRYKEYNEESLANMNSMLDARADILKRKWCPEYAKLAGTVANGITFDLDKRDYAEIKVFIDECVVRTYKMDWCYNDLMETAIYISDRCNPDPEEFFR